MAVKGVSSEVVKIILIVVGLAIIVSLIMVMANLANKNILNSLIKLDFLRHGG